MANEEAGNDVRNVITGKLRTNTFIFAFSLKMTTLLEQLVYMAAAYRFPIALISINEG
jgi:hypothetical protein